MMLLPEQLRVHIAVKYICSVYQISSLYCDENAHSYTGMELERQFMNAIDIIRWEAFYVLTFKSEGYSLVYLEDFADFKKRNLNSECGYTYVAFKSSYLTKITEILDVQLCEDQLPPQQVKGTKVSKLATAATVTATKNKLKALAVAEVKVGQGGLALVESYILPHAPMGTKSFLKSDWGKLAIANFLVFGVQHFAPENNKANLISDAMLSAAMHKLGDKIDIEGMIEDFTTKLDGAQLDKILAAAKDA